MKRPIISLFALVLALGPAMLAAGPALAERGDGGRGARGDRVERRLERVQRDDRRFERGRENRGRGRDDGAPPWAGGRRFEGPPRYAPPRSQWRRGGYLPPGSRGVRIYSYDRHRLRPPPPGFIWYQVGDDYLLTETVTGRIFEVVPRY